jgi:nitroimidazol reductase NimA-like FMN-containing flavoprotein (pyridoxamine 5'-phosphate oxidase superfamily)
VEIMMEDLVRRLLVEQNECTLGWLARDGRPVASVVSFVWLDGRIAMTALEDSPRVRAIRRDPRVSVTVSGLGSPVGQARCVSIQGRCEIRDDAATRDRFFPAFSRAVLPDSERGALAMASAMNTPENLVLMVEAEKWIPYDAQARMEMAGRG